MSLGGVSLDYAYWNDSQTGILVLTEDWPEGEEIPLSLEGVDAFESLTPLNPRELASFSGYSMPSPGKIVFSIDSERLKNTPSGQRVFLASSFNGWGEVIGNKDFELKRNDSSKGCFYELVFDFESLEEHGEFSFKFITDGNEWLEVPAFAPNRVKDASNNFNYIFRANCLKSYIYQFTVPHKFKNTFNSKLVLDTNEGTEEFELSPGPPLLDLGSDLKLGSFLESQKTVFRVFAPRADFVELHISPNSGMECANRFQLKRGEYGVWEVSLEGDRNNEFYFYKIDGPNCMSAMFDGDCKIVDPYAKALFSAEGPALVKTEGPSPQGSSFVLPHFKDLVILEAHLGDLVYDFSDSEQSVYTQVSNWIKSSGAYLRKINVNAVELLPVHQFEQKTKEEYAWGYMPVNYFSPASSYALNPSLGSQVEEFQELVKNFHDEGIALILDVVYNHFGNPNYLAHIDKYYYFNLDYRGGFINWSGCGNDSRVDTEMFKRLVIESLSYWVNTFDVDGFRFDLGELLGKDLLLEIEQELKKIKPSIYLIAEPWSFRGSLGNSLKDTSYACWNDGFREFIPKYLKGLEGVDGLKYFLAGSTGWLTNAPWQTVNYTQSHDDYAWIDRITTNDSNDGSSPSSEDIRTSHLMFALLMVSLGVPMLAQGQDFLHSKKGHPNTYQNPELNGLSYQRLLDFSETHEYVASWIKFRLSKEGRALRLRDRPRDGYLKFFSVNNSPALGVLYNANVQNSAPRLFFGVNPSCDLVKIPLAEKLGSRFKQVTTVTNFEAGGLSPSDSFRCRGNSVEIPSLNCGLWVEV